jgi:hypothetical protein
MLRSMATAANKTSWSAFGAVFGCEYAYSSGIALPSALLHAFVFYFSEITPLEYFSKLIEKRTEYLRAFRSGDCAVETKSRRSVSCSRRATACL